MATGHAKLVQSNTEMHLQEVPSRHSIFHSNFCLQIAMGLEISLQVIALVMGFLSNNYVTCSLK